MAQNAAGRRAPLAYVEEGQSRPGALPLLLVHGWAARASFFAAQIPAFARETRVIAPDLPGHGASRDVPTGDIPALADALARLLDACKVGPVLAVGWSMGASVLWELAARTPERFAGIVSVDMTPRVLNDAQWRLGLPDGFDAGDCERTVAAMRADWARYCERVAANVLAEGAETTPPHALFADNDADVMAACWRALASFDARPLIPCIATPMIVAYGARSKLYAPDVSAWIERTAPNAVRVPFRRSGHAPHIEEPEAFNRLIREFAALLTGQDAKRDLQRLGRDAAAV
jgi:pimeloyl-[acyl-carrier protein] methyl ester esterase